MFLIVEEKIKKIHARLKRIEAYLLAAEQSRGGIEWYVANKEALTLKRIKKMNLKVTQSLPLSIAIQDRFGNKAPVDGIPEWSLTAPDSATLSVSADGMSAILTPSGPLVPFEVHVNADADLGAGVKSILGVLPIEMMPGDAEIIAIAAGSPTDMPL